MAVQYVVPGKRFTPIVVRGDTAFSALMDNSMQAVLVSTGRVLWTTQLRVNENSFVLHEIASTRDLLVVGLGQSVVAVRRFDGAVVWRYTPPEENILANVGISADSNFVTFAQGDNEATVLRAESGAVVWRRFLLPRDASSFTNSPIISNGIVTYGRNKRVGQATDGEPIVFALRVATGELLWTITADHSAKLDSWTSLSAFAWNGSVFFTLQSGRIVSAALETGIVNWVSAPPTQYPGSQHRFSVSGGELLATYDAAPGGAESFNPISGAANWRYESPIGAPISSLSVGNSMMVFSALGGLVAFVDRVSRETRVIWPEHLKVGGENITFYPSPVMVGDVVLAPSSSGLIAMRRNRL